MSDKKRKSYVIVAIVLAVLLLAVVGLMLLKGKEQKRVSNEDDTHQSMTIEDKRTTVTWEQEEFQDETKKVTEKTDAEVKGGSKTLEIILPKENEIDGETEQKTAVEWFSGIW